MREGDFQREEVKGKVEKMKIINLHVCKVQSSWQRNFIHITFQRRKTCSYLQAVTLQVIFVFFFCFSIFSGYFCNDQIIGEGEKKPMKLF